MSRMEWSRGRTTNTPKLHCTNVPFLEDKDLLTRVLLISGVPQFRLKNLTIRSER